LVSVTLNRFGRRERTKIASGESTNKGETKDRHLREHECFADFAEGDAFRCLPQRSLEALDRLTKAFGAETESLMMDRHDEMSASFIGHVHGLFRSAVRMLPGVVIGVAAALAPKYLPKLGTRLQPLFNSTVRSAYKLGRKAQSAVGEIQERVNDITAEGKAEEEVKSAEPAEAATKPATLANV
jgi:hypothetical protein